MVYVAAVNGLYHVTSAVIGLAPVYLQDSADKPPLAAECHVIHTGD